jgi:3-hydroxyisobutyrate dehydrogenase
VLVGIVGLGNMGAAMAANLVSAGHEVASFDVVREHVRGLEARGAHGASSAPDAAPGAEVTLEHVAVVMGQREAAGQ